MTFWVSGVLSLGLTTPVYADMTASYHIQVVRDATKIDVYVNNVLAVTLNATQAIAAGTLPMYFGDIGQPTTTIKNVTYYNRALTSAELTQNYNALK